eukprot:scaffold3425_cov65-Phaeocystis_antarctica.AAC.5
MLRWPQRPLAALIAQKSAEWDGSSEHRPGPRGGRGDAGGGGHCTGCALDFACLPADSASSPLGSHDQHDTQPNERPHCAFVAVVVGAVAALGAIDEHVILSGAARHGRANVHMAIVVVIVILRLADLTLATLPDGRLGAAPSHASPSATCQLFARRLGIKRPASLQR